MNDIKKPAPSAHEIIECESCYEGFFTVLRYRIRHRLYRGGWSQEITREVFERDHAAGVLLYDPKLDQVVLVEQFRAAAISAPGGAWIIEVVAGIIEPGTDPEMVIRRETVEETNLSVREVEYLGEFLLTPGGSSERLSLFCGRIDSTSAGGVYGLISEGEDIRVVVMNADDALAAIADGRIYAANAVLALQWFSLNRDRLRGSWLAKG